MGGERMLISAATATAATEEEDVPSKCVAHTRRVCTYLYNEPRVVCVPEVVHWSTLSLCWLRWEISFPLAFGISVTAPEMQDQ